MTINPEVFAYLLSTAQTFDRKVNAQCRGYYILSDDSDGLVKAHQEFRQALAEAEAEFHRAVRVANDAPANGR